MKLETLVTVGGASPTTSSTVFTGVQVRGLVKSARRRTPRLVFLRITPLIRKRHARVALGLAATVFNELEDAFVETFVDSLAADSITVRASSPATTRVGLVSRERLRLALRPSLEVRFSDQLSTKGHIYFKLPADEPFEIDDHLDYRVDALLSATLKLAENAEGDETVAITWESREAFDNLPPRIGDDRIAAERLALRRFRDAQAPRRHRSGMFKLSVKW